MTVSRTVIVDGLRSPFCKLGGGLSNMPAVDLAAPLIKAVLATKGIDGNLVDEVILGQVIQAGAGQIPSRQALFKAGLPVTCESTTINKVCASGMRAVTLGDLRIRANDGDIIIAGGMESMSQAPYLIPANVARFGKKMGDVTMQDSMLTDGLQCPVNNVPMIAYGSQTAEEFSISREEQDKWALRSHQRAVEAQANGRFSEEILPYTVMQGKKQIIVDKDEGPRPDTSLEILSALKPVYNDKGSVTAGNAPGVNDGACVLLLMSEEKAAELKVKPLARLITHASIGQEVPYLATVPALATQKALSKAGLTIKDIGLMEINEAFSVVVLQSAKMLGIDLDKVNVNGGAIALGHPIGASGARIILTLVKEMQKRGTKYGAAAICSGTAQGDCVILEAIS